MQKEDPIEREHSGGFCFVIELPWDIAVPDGHRIPLFGSGGSHAAEPRRSVYDLLGTQPRPDKVLKGWLQFRTVAVSAQRPLEAADRAFGRVERDIARSRWFRWTRTLNLWRVTGRRHIERRTVVAAYGFHPPMEHSDEELSLFFVEIVGRLNDYLVSLGVAFDDRLRPVAPRDLPPVVPLMVFVVDAVGSLWHGASRPVVLRDPPGDLRVYRPDELTKAERMFDIVQTREGLATFFEIVQRAGSARRANRDREAVIDYATAGELFVTEILQRVGPAAGIEPAKLTRIVGGPFRDRARHLCRCLGLPEAVDAVESPLFAWWLHCYLPRNDIVHAGKGSHEVSSELARIGLVTLVCGVRDALRADPLIAEFASDIQWGFVVDESGAGESSFSDPLA